MEAVFLYCPLLLVAFILLHFLKGLIRNIAIWNVYHNRTMGVNNAPCLHLQFPSDIPQSIVSLLPEIYSKNSPPSFSFLAILSQRLKFQSHRNLPSSCSTVPNLKMFKINERASIPQNSFSLIYANHSLLVALADKKSQLKVIALKKLQQLTLEMITGKVGA